MNRTATTSWRTEEADPQRVGILAAADRMLSGKPQRCSGNLSVSQLAVEADVKYWVIAQKHTDLRDHFQRLAVAARRAAHAHDDDNDPIVKLRQKKRRTHRPLPIAGTARPAVRRHHQRTDPGKRTTAQSWQPRHQRCLHAQPANC